MADRNDETLVWGVPQIYIDRDYTEYHERRKTTGNLGDIIPLYTTVLVQPGDTLSIDGTFFTRLTTSLFPSMDSICCDVFAFANDEQNTWDHEKEFRGEDLATPFEETTEYTTPQFVIEPTDAVEHDDILHHISVPAMEAGKAPISTIERTQNIEVERLSYNTYCDIYNHYFRDQNYIPKKVFSKGDEDIKYSDLANKKLFKAARLHDYFSGVPEPQRYGPEYIPVGTEAPVVGDGKTLGLTDGFQNFGMANGSQSGGSVYINSAYYNQNVGGAGSPSTVASASIGLGVVSDPEKSGLIADLTSTIGATINALRLVTATQQIKEELMWYGARFEEMIYSQWGVGINPATMRIPEYLGGQRFWLNMDTVLQTSQSSTTSPLGDAAGYSTTYNEQHLFTKSFTTWQHVMILIVFRQNHTYSYGIKNEFMKKRKFEFFWKKFEGIGAQPRLKKEICVTGTNTDNDVWNYAPAWREYESGVDRATGLMQPGVQDSLAYYTYADEYETIPNSGEEWIEEVPDFVDRTLVVPSTTTDQFVIDADFTIKKTSIIKSTRLPGLDKL